MRYDAEFCFDCDGPPEHRACDVCESWKVHDDAGYIQRVCPTHIDMIECWDKGPHEPAVLCVQCIRIALHGFVNTRLGLQAGNG